MNSCILSLQDYKMISVLAFEGQANVYLCQKHSRLYAIKLYRNQRSSLSSFTKESQILYKLKHKNVLLIYQSIQSGCIKYMDGTQQNRPIIVLNYAEKGDLSQYITIGKGFTSAICKRIFKQLIDGLKYISNMGISHRDIKPQNILIDNNFQLKISDFGFSALMQSQKRLQTKVGTDGFQAPEVYQGQYNGEKIDIFSLGVTFFLLFTGELPFTSAKKSNQLYRYFIKQNYKRFWLYHQRKRPENFFPQQFKTLINRMLSTEPNDRPQFKDLKESDWINSDVASIQEMTYQLDKRYKIMVQNQSFDKKQI